MTDHRITDLAYGHLGEASYDVDEEEWRFSIEPTLGRNLRQLLPLRSCIPPSIPNVPSPRKSTSIRSQVRQFLKSFPETFPAYDVVSALAQAPSTTKSRLSPSSGQLLAVGKAVDIEQTLGSRTTTIIAVPCGEAGHVLRLIRPRIERHEWGRQSTARLSLMDPGSPDEGFWSEIGGTILQIVFADDGKPSNTWLAVRQANVTTIFRPTYSKNLEAPSGYAKEYPPSHVCPNPVATLAANRTGSESHVDLSFNPWYTHQFAVVDEMGSWSIWDIEGRQKKGSSIDLVPGKKANIYDGHSRDPNLKVPGNGDGWHQILWAGSVSTIVVCSRRHLAVFDIKATPTRLQGTELLAASNTDWILDVKRSPVSLSHLFVLTSSRIFWLEVISAGEEKVGNFGARVIISYRHFRDPNDATMRLATLKYEEGTVMISSGQSPLINFYTFSSNSDGLGPTSSRGSLKLFKNINDSEVEGLIHLQTLCFIETPLRAIASRPAGPEVEYIDENIKFYQLLTLTWDLMLSSTLCTMQSISSKLHIIAPTTNYIQPSRGAGSQRVVDDSFIVPDGSLDDETFNRPQKPRIRRGERSSSGKKLQDALRLGIDFTRVYQEVFLEAGSDESQAVDSADKMKELLENAADRIQQGKRDENLGMATLLELSQIPGFAEDLEQAAPILQDFLLSLELDDEPDASSALILSNLTLCPGIDFPTNEGTRLVDLLKVYDQVAEDWLASLPPRVPNLTRLAKFKAARKVAVEVCLSSIAASLRNKSSQVTSMSIPSGDELPALLNKTIDLIREDSPAFSSSQIPSSSLQEASFSLPTPVRTPSVYSHPSTSEPTEDPAISRLRQYAVSIKSKPDLGTSSLLYHWPSEPGADPAQYSWEAMQKASAADESGGESNYRKRREEARRRRRTEKFLSREKANAAEAISQPDSRPFGSQPDVNQHIASSQTVVDMPMTQPDRGAYGSRSAQQGKKKQKKRRAAGF